MSINKQSHMGIFTEAGVDILREEGPFGKGIFEVLQGRISGY